MTESWRVKVARPGGMKVEGFQLPQGLGKNYSIPFEFLVMILILIQNNKLFKKTHSVKSSIYLSVF